MISAQHGRRIALLLIAGAGLASIARAITLSFVAIRLEQQFGLGPAMIGALLGIGPLLGAVAAPLAGSLSDWVGRKWVLGLTLFGMAASLVGLGLAPSLTAFCSSQIACAVAVAIYEPISRALISDACPPGLRLRYFSWRYTISNIGWAVGPLIGIAVGVSTRVPFFIGALIYIAFAAALFIVYGKIDQHLEPPAANVGRTSILGSIVAATRDPRLAFFVGGGTLLIAIYGQWSATLSPYLLHSMPSGVHIFAYMLSTNGIVVLVSNTLSRRVIERLGALGSMSAGCLLFCAGELGFLASASLAGFIASMVVFTLGEIFVVPAEYMLVDGIAAPGNRGSYFGAHAFSSIGNFIGPTIGGLALGAFGGPGLFLLFAAFAIASAVLFSIGTRMPPPHQRRRSGEHRPLQQDVVLSPLASLM